MYIYLIKQYFKMAELSNYRKAAKPDMTPMVDLGFLLITFFMFTTTFTVPSVMRFVLPDDGAGAPISEENMLVLILEKDDTIFWHQKNEEDLNKTHIHKSDFDPDTFRELILNKRKLAKKPQNFTVIIKPTVNCQYKNLVDVLDEMLITAQNRYVVVEPSKKEFALLNP